MQIIVQCPYCSNVQLLDVTAADKRLRCPECQKLFKVPRLEEVPKAVKVIKTDDGAILIDEKGRTYG
ncbi:MAG: hypothetical protein ACYTBP_02110 [Planctomycetota bacterium]